MEKGKGTEAYEMFRGDSVVLPDPNFLPRLLYQLLHWSHSARESQPGAQIRIRALHSLGVPALGFDVVRAGVAPEADVDRGSAAQNLVK